MSNPFRSAQFRAIQYLPWRALFLSAGVAIVAIAIVEFLVFQLAAFLSGLALGTAGDWFFELFFFVLVPALLAFGLGAIALLVAARFFQQIPLRKDTMWTLVLCTIVLLPVKNLVMFNLFSVPLGIVPACLIAAGLFTAGRRYWRY